MTLLEIRNVTRRFGALTAVDNVSLSVEAGEFFTLPRPSGCGKTPLLRMAGKAPAEVAALVRAMLDGVHLPDKVGSTRTNSRASRRWTEIKIRWAMRGKTARRGTQP